ncbi:MAG: serine--tRNA ligase, partial [Sphingobacteriales bacterium]
MLQLQVIRKQKDLVLERLAHKNFSEPHLVEEIIGLDDKRRGILTANEQLLAKRNAASKEIGALMAQGKKEEAEAKKQEVAAMKSEIEKLEAELA